MGSGDHSAPVKVPRPQVPRPGDGARGSREGEQGAGVPKLQARATLPIGGAPSKPDREPGTPKAAKPKPSTNPRQTPAPSRHMATLVGGLEGQAKSVQPAAPDYKRNLKTETM